MRADFSNLDYPEENINTYDLGDKYEWENDFFTDFRDKGATGGVLSKSVLTLKLCILNRLILFILLYFMKF